MTVDYLKLKLTIAQELDQESDSFEPPLTCTQSSSQPSRVAFSQYKAKTKT